MGDGWNPTDKKSDFGAGLLLGLHGFTILELIAAMGMYTNVSKAIGSTVPKFTINGLYKPSKYGWFIIATSWYMTYNYFDFPWEYRRYTIRNA